MRTEVLYIVRVVRYWKGYIMLIAPLALRQQTTRTNHEVLFDMFWLCLTSKKGLPIFLGIEIKTLDPLACENIRFSSTKSEEKRMFSQAIDPQEVRTKDWTGYTDRAHGPLVMDLYICNAPLKKKKKKERKKEGEMNSK